MLFLEVSCVMLGLFQEIQIYHNIRSKDGHLSKFGQFLHDLFHFKKLYLEEVLKFLYVFSTVSCVAIGAFLLIGKVDTYWSSTPTFGYGVALIILGPIFTRFSYELLMLSIILVKNAIEINNKLNGTSGVSFATTENKVCPSCGATITGGAFCGKCGAKLD